MGDDRINFLLLRKGLNYGELHGVNEENISIDWHGVAPYEIGGTKGKREPRQVKELHSRLRKELVLCQVWNHSILEL